MRIFGEMPAYQTSSQFTLTILLACCAVIHSVAAQDLGVYIVPGPCPGDRESCVTINSNFSLSAFRQNSAIAGRGAISTTDSALTISGASLPDSSDCSGGDSIHAYSSEVTVESCDGELSSQCLRYTNSGVSSYEMNWPLLLFMIVIMFVLVNIKYCINCVGYTLGFIVYCCIVIVAYNDSDVLIMFNNT